MRPVSRSTSLGLSFVCFGAMSLAGPFAASGALLRPSDRYPHLRDDQIVFSIEAPRNAEVQLMGDFNAWDPGATPMERRDRDIWEAALSLAPGEYRYRFLIDGELRLDPSNPDEVRDPDGRMSSRIRVLHDGKVSRTTLWQRDPIRDRDWSLRAASHRDFAVGASLSFNRVDGTVFWAKPSFHPKAAFVPALDARFGYGWESERLTVEVDVAQPIAPERRLLLGARYLNGTGCDNEAEIGIGENTLAGLFLKHDFIDYYDVEGIEPYVSLVVRSATTLRLSYANERYQSLTTQTQWSFFSAGTDEFRPNPQLYLLGDPAGRGGEGRLAAGRLEIVRDTRRARHIGTIGSCSRAFLEWGAGDFDYARWIADVRSYTRLGRPSHLALRARAGARFLGDTIPSQKLFDVGGLGTVRGHAFFAQVGDRELLGNVEYTLLSERLNHGLMFFYDAGTAWNSMQGGLQDTSVLQSVGVGLRSLNDDFQVDFAWPIGAIEGQMEVSVRLNRTF